MLGDGVFEVFDKCPRLIVTDAEYSALVAARYDEQGCFPAEGTWMDQTEGYHATVATVRNLKARAEAGRRG